MYRNVMVPVLVDQASGGIIRDPKTGFAYRQPYEKGGEIIVAVPDVASFAGYHRNPEATMKKFERNVFKKGDLWYRSGDALRRDKDGRWFFMDRYLLALVFLSAIANIISDWVTHIAGNQKTSQPLKCLNDLATVQVSSRP